MFAGPQKSSVLAKWGEVAPAGSLGLVAPFVLTHRKSPVGQKLWPHDPTTGEFRITEAGRTALASLVESVALLHASCVVFRSPETHSPSAANREQLRTFFGELATAEAIGVERVWVPGGLWEVRAAVKLAGELGVTCAIDPTVRDPNDPPEIHEDLEAEALYFRIESAGRAGTLRAEKLEDLAVLLEHYEHLPVTVAFASPERWHDARNFKKLLDA